YMKKTLLIIYFITFLVLDVIAQSRLLTGTIKDNQNRPISNASILVKGSNLSTISDGAGNFEIRLTCANATLIFSAVGYEDQEIPTQNKDRLNVIMEERNIGLDEVVVVGFSSVDKKHVASSVSQMDMSSTKNRPIIKLEQAFSGTIPGVTMLQGNSLPGANAGNISIRGMSTLQN